MKQKQNNNIQQKNEKKSTKIVRLDTEATHMVNKKNKTHNKINYHQ